ncbi:MAG: hypothetical protein ACFFBF_15705 [Promethearchaeota archaeon]
MTKNKTTVGNKSSQIILIAFLIIMPLVMVSNLSQSTESGFRPVKKPNGLINADPLITLTFSGMITLVGIQCPDVFADTVVGDTWTLTYTFDAATGDVDGNPMAGQYQNPITVMTLRIGSATVSGTPGQAIPNDFSSLIFVNLITSGFADYAVQTGIPDASAWASVSLWDDTGTPFTDDSLPLSIPAPLDAKFPTLRRFSLRAPGSSQVCIMGTVENSFCSVLVHILILNVEILVDNGVLKPGNGNALIKKLDIVMDLLDRNNFHAASQKMNDFIVQVEALINSRRLPIEEGQELIAQAQEIIELLDTT